MIQLKILTGGDYVGLMKFTQCIHMGLHNIRAGGLESR